MTEETEDVDLPTAVQAWVKTSVNFEVTGYGHDYLKDRDELVRRQDAEAKVQEKAHEGYAQGRMEERQRILELIDQQLEAFDDEIQIYDEPEKFMHKKEAMRQFKGLLREKIEEGAFSTER